MIGLQLNLRVCGHRLEHADHVGRIGRPVPVLRRFNPHAHQHKVRILRSAGPPSLGVDVPQLTGLLGVLLHRRRAVDRDVPVLVRRGVREFLKH